MAGWAFSVAWSSASGPSSISRPSGIAKRSSAWRSRAFVSLSFSIRSRAIPTNWAPWPGNRTARAIGTLVGLDDFAPVVIAAIAADRVRPLRLVALRTLDELWSLQRQLSTSLTLAGMGISRLRQSHRQQIIARLRRAALIAERLRLRPAADDLDFFGGFRRRWPQ